MARRKQSNRQTDDTLVDIVEVTESAQGFLEKNQNIILGALLGVVLLIGGIMAYRFLYKAPRSAEAVEQMFQAQRQFERDSFAVALANPGGGYSGFLEIIDNYGGTPSANLARYYAGVSYLNLGQYQAAIDYLKQYKPSGEITPIMKYGAMGDAYSELGNFSDALSYYERAVKAGDNEMLTAYYLKKLGLLNEKQGNYTAAQNAYEQIRSKYPNSPDGRDIEKYIMRVGAKG